MSVLESRVYSTLSASTLVTGSVGTRIYPIILPQEPKLPAITYDLISNVRESVMSVDSGTAHARVQINIHADTYADASSISESVRSVIQRYATTEAAQTSFNISDSTGTDASEIFSTVTTARGQSFQITGTTAITASKIRVRYWRSACTTGDTDISLYTASTDHLPDTLISSQNLPASQIPTSSTSWAEIPIDQELQPATLYMFAITPSTAITGTTCYVYVRRARAVPAGTGSTGLYTSGKMVFSSTTEPGWTNHADRERDMFFQIMHHPDRIHDVYLESESSTYDPDTSTYVHTWDALIHYEE